jgi:hypothetical protein
VPLPGNLEGAAYVRVRARLLYVRGIETMLAALYTMRHTEVHTTMCTRRNVYARSVHGTLARSLTRTHASGRSMHVLTTLGLAAAAAHAPPDHDTTSKVKVSGDTFVVLAAAPAGLGRNLFGRSVDVRARREGAGGHYLYVRTLLPCRDPEQGPGEKMRSHASRYPSVAVCKSGLTNMIDFLVGTMLPM